MCFKRTILLALALYFSMPAHAQQKCDVEFSGQVLNEDNEPIPGAGVLLLPKQIGRSTDADGNFRFSDLCEGRYTLRVQYLGYQDVELDVVISASVRKTIRLKELATELKEVVIRHHDDTHTEHAANFVQMNEHQLAETAGKSLGESMKRLPGVNSIQTGPGIFKPVIHGVHSQRILILNHGLRQEGQQWGAEHAPEIDPFIASNIVVIKDASAIKYGADALGGVIIVNPRALPETGGLGGTFNSVLQSNGRSATVSGMVEGGIKDHDGWGWRAQGTLKRTGDFNTAGYGLANTGVKESNFSLATGHHKERAGFDVFFSHFSTEIGILKGSSTETIADLFAAMTRPQPLYTRGFSYSIREPRQDVSHNLLKVNGHVQAGGGEWRMQYGFQNNNRQEYDLRIGGLSNIPAIDMQLNTHTLDIERETAHSEKRTLTFGLNSIYQVNRNIFGTQRIPFIPNFNSISSGAFGVAKLFFERWTVDFGARYDYRHYEVKGFDFKNTFYQTSFDFNNISATVGVVRQLPQQQSLSASVSTSWRPPHVAELYSVGKHQSVAAIEYGLMLDEATNEVMDINDVDFKVEQAVKFVATYQLGNSNLSLNISPFMNYIFNYIYLRAGGITQSVRGAYPYFRYDQTDALFLGADVNVSWRPHRFFTVSPQVSLLRASDETQDDYFMFIPSNRYELNLRYERPSWNKAINAYVESGIRFVARQQRSPRVITVEELHDAQVNGTDLFGDGKKGFDFMPPPDGYMLLNLSAGFSVRPGKIQYDFRIASDNTLNHAYREYTNRLRYYADDLGRNLIISFKCIF